MIKRQINDSVPNKIKEMSRAMNIKLANTMALEKSKPISGVKIGGDV